MLNLPPSQFSLADRPSIEKKPSSLSVAEGKSSGLEKEFSLSVAEGKSLGLENEPPSLARLGLSGRKAGHSIVEYALPAVLVGLIVVGSAAALMNGGFSQTGAMSQFGGKSIVNASMTTRSLGENPLAQNMILTTERGNRLTLSGVPLSVAESLEVAGAHGTIEMYNAALRNLADQLLAAGEIDEAQANAIKNVANKGHAMGQDLAQLEGMMDQCGGSIDCLRQAYFFDDSKGDQIEKIHGRLSTNGIGDLDAESQAFYGLTLLTPGARKGVADLYSYNHYDLGQKITMGPGLRSFFEAVGQVNLKSLSPSVQEVFRYFGQSVARTSHISASVIRTYAESGTGTTANFAQDVIANMTGGPPIRPAVLVHGDSGGICATGQGKDTGTTCR